MKLESQSFLYDTAYKYEQADIKTSKAAVNSRNFSDVNKIDDISDQNVVSAYFDLFDESFSELTIKNLLNQRLQPAYLLPKVHNTDLLAAKANELLNFSVAI